MAPFAVKIEGAITQAEFRETVPVVVIVPPKRPVPAVIEVTVPDPPPPPAAHLIPSAQVLSAVNTRPSLPTGKAVGTVAAVPVIREPLAVTHVLGMAAEAASNAVFTAFAVAAVVVEVLVTASHNCTAPG
jgi:hypothetical protein